MPGYRPEELQAAALAGKLLFPDAYALTRLLHRHRPASILEVGSFVGFSTRWLLECSSDWNASVTSVDPNIRHRMFDSPGAVLREFNARFTPERLEVIEAFFGNPGECSYEDYENYTPRRNRAEVDELFGSRPRLTGGWERRFDFIFLDGDHEFSAVMRDFEIAVRLLNPGGCIAFHDAIGWKDVAQAMRQISEAYSSRATVRTIGVLDHAILWKVFRKFNSGVGVFTLNASGEVG